MRKSSISTFLNNNSYFSIDLWLWLLENLMKNCYLIMKINHLIILCMIYKIKIYNMVLLGKVLNVLILITKKVLLTIKLYNYVR